MYFNSTVLFMLHVCVLFLPFRVFLSEPSHRGFARISWSTVDSCLFAVIATLGWVFSSLRFYVFVQDKDESSESGGLERSARLGLAFPLHELEKKTALQLFCPLAKLLMYCTPWRLGCLIWEAGNNRISVLVQLSVPIFHFP